jgi:short-subunit dehydrogenase
MGYLRGMGRTIENMVVVITGASSGIGRALALHLARKRARLVLAARRTDRLDSLNFAMGGRHLCVGCDVAQPDQCERLIAAAVARFGRIDTLVCNAGYGRVRTVVDTPPAEMRAIFATNVFGTTDCIRAAAPIMEKQELRDGIRGQLMIVSSAAGRRGLPYFGSYTATKAAQLSIAEALRVELRPLKIAVTSVHPVGTKTEFFEQSETDGAGMLPPETSRGMTQTAEQVALRMARAIASPVAELWPFDPARWMLALTTMFPALGDAIMESARQRIARWNRRPSRQW